MSLRDNGFVEFRSPVRKGKILRGVHPLRRARQSIGKLTKGGVLKLIVFVLVLIALKNLLDTVFRNTLSLLLIMGIGALSIVVIIKTLKTPVKEEKEENDRYEDAYYETASEEVNSGYEESYDEPDNFTESNINSESSNFSNSLKRIEETSSYKREDEEDIPHVDSEIVTEEEKNKINKSSYF